MAKKKLTLTERVKLLEKESRAHAGSLRAHNLRLIDIEETPAKKEPDALQGEEKFKEGDYFVVTEPWYNGINPVGAVLQVEGVDSDQCVRTAYSRDWPIGMVYQPGVSCRRATEAEVEAHLEAERVREEERSKPIEFGAPVRTDQGEEGLYWFVDNKDQLHRIVLPNKNLVTVDRKFITLLPK